VLVGRGEEFGRKNNKIKKNQLGITIVQKKSGYLSIQKRVQD
jgi:hypothetical protein